MSNWIEESVREIFNMADRSRKYHSELLELEREYGIL